MLHLHRDITINAKPDAVWAVLSRYMHIDEFAPFIDKVDALTDGENGVGSKRRNHFSNGDSMVEEVTGWKPNHSYAVRMSEMGTSPITEASSIISVKRVDGNRSSVNWTFDYRMKPGIFGWLLGKTILRRVMGKVLTKNLKGLDEKVSKNNAVAV